MVMFILKLKEKSKFSLMGPLLVLLRSVEYENTFFPHDEFSRIFDIVLH